jgi:hypothetical protein
MKHLLTAIACCLAVAGSAQTPYNPDSNTDYVIGVDDLMGLLSLFGGDFLPSYEIEKQVCDGLDTCYVNESTNWLEFNATYPVSTWNEETVVLPESTTWKKLIFATELNSIYQQIEVKGGADTFNMSAAEIQGPTAVIFIRDDNGIWWREN